ncbi:ankyrin repeat domain-containing protein [Rickettsia sp. TH2014]|uniref:ankyrin repeat domain-containing protein n=1 Tax=Rickettsia sp. TH2014 TaxID=1967503 RepID=UPI0021154CFD|nr:ankyrin repeat domain-containing protein [Rickettsia sp. TH2014]
MKKISRIFQFKLLNFAAPCTIFSIGPSKTVYGYDTKLEHLCKAISNNNIDLVTSLLKQAQQKSQYNQRCIQERETPLILAISNNNIKVVQMLLDFGVDIEQEGSPPK